MKMFDRLIEENLWTRKEYYWDFQGYKVPRLISGGAVKIEETRLDIENNHNNLVENNKNLPNVKEFKRFFKKEFKDYLLIEEFPIPIIRETWKHVYMSYGGRKPGTMNKMWFSLDFYIPALKTAIQLDSKIGHGTNDNKIRDLAEDVYLWFTHGITTIRSSKLQFEDLIGEETKRLKEEIGKLKEKRSIEFDFTRQFIEFIYSYYEKEFLFLEKFVTGSLIYNEISGEKTESESVTLYLSKMSNKDREFLKETTINSFIMGGVELTRQENISYLYRSLFRGDLKFKP